MVTFAASKFDPETDPDRPKMYDEIDFNNKKHVIKKVDHILASDFMKLEEEPDKEGHDIFLVKPHSVRPGVMWMIHADEYIVDTKKLVVVSFVECPRCGCSTLYDLEQSWDCSRCRYQWANPKFDFKKQ